MNKNNLPLTDEQRWRAVVGRDASLDGRFIFAVRSTGVYCRPGCRARTPRRSQVVFFDTPAQARAAGFRACKRCQPDGPTPRTRLVEQVCELLDRPGRPLTLAELGEHLDISPNYLQRTFKAEMGVSPRVYAARRRAERFKDKMRQRQPVAQAAYAAGFGSGSSLYEDSEAWLGMTPAAYGNGGAGMDVRYTIVDCFLGRMLLAATQKGVCALAFETEDAPLEAFVRAEFPAAQVQRDDAALASWAGALVAALAAARPAPDLPLDVQATAFQARVWQELRRIPYGETRSYTQVAQQLGQPSAARAVARACATNPASLVIPCHRVLRGDGSLAGYRWGLARKQALLERERQ